VVPHGAPPRERKVDFALRMEGYLIGTIVMVASSAKHISS
jgi:hypothetical protein